MKKVLFVLAASFIMSSVAMAAPVTKIEQGEVNAGYLYWHPKVEVGSVDLGNSSVNGFFIETGLTDKLVLGIETSKGDKTKYGATFESRFTDVTVQYKTTENVRIIAGNRNYDTDVYVPGYYSGSESTNKFIYGLSASAPIGEKTAAYASVLNDSYGTDWQLGVNQSLSDKFTINVNYRYYDGDGVTLKGLGAGLVYMF